MVQLKYCSGDYTLDVIATHLGITRERVRQIEQAALKKLRHPKVGKTLREYLDATWEEGGDHVSSSR